MYGVLSLRSHRVPSVGAFYRFLPAWLRRTAAAALTLGTIGALGAILTVMAEDPACVCRSSCITPLWTTHRALANTSFRRRSSKAI